MRRRLAIIPRSLGSLDYEFVPVRNMTQFDRDNLIGTVLVTQEEYEVLCGQRDEYEAMQDTIERLLMKNEPVQKIPQT